MNIKQISQGLLAKFEQCRLVFWQDTDQEFVSQLDELSLNDDSEHSIEVIRLDDLSHFQVKERIELLEPETPFLLYSTKAVNKPERDWLYDIRLYAENFYADSSSMVLNELGMRMEFRPVVTQHRAFFTNKSRVSRLKKILPNKANKEELQLALIAASLKVESPTFVTILQQLIVELASIVEASGSLSEVSEADKLFSELKKYNLEEPFWHFAKDTVGYELERSDADNEEHTQLTSGQKLQDLVIKLLFTECYQALQNSGVSNSNPMLERFTQQLLPIELDDKGQRKASNTVNVGMNSSKRAMSVNIVKSFRESRSMAHAYNVIAAQVEQEFELKNIISLIKDPQQLYSVETFEYAEQQLIILLARNINELDQVDIDNIVSHRLTTHWAHSKPNYAAILNAIKAAKQFYTLKQQYIDGFNYDSARAMYQAYEKELYLFDAAYRVFYENAIKVAHNGSDILKKTGLVSDIEALYVDWYLHDLAISWGKLVDDESLLENWKLPGIPNQYEFYSRQVENVFQTTQVQKIFVIISDALRYEVAHEISDQINNEKRYLSEIQSQLGVVPSYTQLGMAALLPHKQLTAHLGARAEYKADGLSVHGHENRQKILAKHNGLAFKSSEVLNWTNEEGRQKVYDARVVYIYHDQIDAIGDTAATENQTFKACADAIVEIKQLIERIVNRLNASRIIVTADHGFLFKSSDVVDSDKTTLTVKPQGSVETKKRYLIGQNLPKGDYYWQGKMAATANLHVEEGADNSDAEFIVPRGSNRFNFVGGAKFIHGGIMPQEICVPVLKIRELDKKQQTKHAKERVSVVPLANPIRLVALADKIELFQASPVGKDYLARELEVWIEDPEGKVVSHKQKVMFDITSQSHEDRKRSVIIMLSGTGFDRTLSYKLMMNDITQANRPNLLQSHSVIIDIAIEDDFF
ncbi:BREX-1 system phosphatase PglZ type A [Oceanisphaera ostreae]|uniref:BREX-1 system phosphatase PglZ type A n=1 Tax=Oceanisphaera ostreae TaxID=914151 RepID=A0ABW3KCC0_9GAMM